LKLLTSFLLGAALAAPAMAGAAALAAPVAVATVEGITEYRLGNGMRVLLFPDASKPTLTTNIVYLVGSRHEHYGETGMAHLLEHLLFKPTANFGIKKGTRSPVDVLNATGADFNGTTSYDRTNYYATFPANDDNLRLMLALEADRMVNSPIDQNDLWNTRTGKGEMTVVRNEFEMGESDPLAVTTERLQAVAFDWHNYGKSTIGARSDIEQVNIGRLRAFYKQYYQPDNAMLMVAGRFDQARVLRQVNELFGRIPRPARVLQPTYTREPVQDGERAVTVRRSGGTQFVGAGYHVAPSSHEDGAALALLARILVDAPAGRLHKALIETKLATSLAAEGVSNLEPGYRIFGAVVPKELPLDVTQAAMLKVLEELKSQPITEAEVARARQNLVKHMELAANDTAALTIELTESMAAGDWRLFFLRRDRIEQTSAAQVQAVAEKYLKASNRTLARFEPTDAPQRSEIPDVGDVGALVKPYKGRAAVAQGEAFDASPGNIDARTERVVLANGMRGALLPKKTKGAMVGLTLRLRTGSAETLKGRAEAAAFAAALLTQGTQRLSRQEIKDSFDKLRTGVSFGGDAEGVTVSLLGSRQNLSAALDLVAELLKTPAYPEPEFAEMQREQVNAIARQMPEPDAMAGNALDRLLDATPEGHVNHVLTMPQKLAALQALKVAEVRAFHHQFYGANNGVFAAVGDFDAAALKAQMATLFGSWNAAQPFVRIPSTISDVVGRKVTLEAPDKANSMLYVVQPVLLRDDAPAYPALLMANHMLGGGALRSRLADRIRQKEGLSYGVGSQVTAGAREAVGVWLAYALSAPQNTAKVEAALREELALALKEGFSEAELADAKKGWRQAGEVARTDDVALAGHLAGYLALERTMAFDRELEAKVAALTVAQVNQALRTYLKPDSLSVISAGDFAKARKP
jgi:zinc protease